MCGQIAYDWNTIDTPRFSAGTLRRSLAEYTESPFRRMIPPLGVSSPATARNVVVLPQPEGPSSVTNSPGAMSKPMLSTAVTSP